MSLSEAFLSFLLAFPAAYLYDRGRKWHARRKWRRTVMSALTQLRNELGGILLSWGWLWAPEGAPVPSKPFEAFSATIDRVRARVGPLDATISLASLGVEDRAILTTVLYSARWVRECREFLMEIVGPFRDVFSDELVHAALRASVGAKHFLETLPPTTMPPDYNLDLFLQHARELGADLEELWEVVLAEFPASDPRAFPSYWTSKDKTL